MNAEIAIIQRRFLALYSDQRAYLNAKPTQALVDLKHECEEQRYSAEFSVRTAAEVNLAACTMILEERGAQ